LGPRRVGHNFQKVALNMPFKLIYHVPGAASRQVSPFDKAIMGMSGAKDIRLASPYLSLNCVRRVIEKCDSWLILTDVEEWISSQRANARLEIKGFIASHCERVHHYPGLHAKVLVAGDRALLGSANFTEKGITQRIEMCALFEKTSEVAEIRDWFDRLWQ
jgi:phosphatidylserine/phosphatidylglycerophosphate/cardiolipin synthase-like enzyme